ncbi:phosphoenolpyruvate carboxykinase [Clostridium cellulovorans]|uniref:Phosphoenolpyruvate carboxykinase n=1 Tax=Clostridium cellulovorans (strain ATCC 35296 / DSM 3052 / OCM 3 / 743B) TaxID=573061 RepID=D9SWX8_CLOC7|nr:phosphoenolpyruvate carboxykinase [Clostridium cellulovorans]ADL51339.1 hypothetical protein Clocel_1592 [Clostridium cellulovorans 743B]
MQKEFTLIKNKVFVNLTAKFCKTPEELFNSYGFNKVLTKYIEYNQKKRSNVYDYLSTSLGEKDILDIVNKLTRLFTLLIVMRSEKILELDLGYEELLRDKDRFYNFIETLYGYWRKMERYTMMQHQRTNDGFESANFIEANENFSRLVLNTYRRIERNSLGAKPIIYRELPVGGNAGLFTSKFKWDLPKGYEQIEDILFIHSIVIDPPFIAYPKRNTRDGLFAEVFENPISQCELTKDHFLCYPVKIGELLAFVYFHRDFMAQGITLCNLFEAAREEEYVNKKPDIVYVFGGKDSEGDKTVFYDDKENDIMVGYVSYGEQIDYFGYMKKMNLTLHNLIMIKRGFLPIHGAMVNLRTHEGKEANIVIMGDSGAGKSESLEAFKGLSEEYISDMIVVFDDMGTIKVKDDKVYGYGTETGAFVRLDDLDPGYAFKEMDRSIFMNPDKTNARLVMPVATYNQIMKGYQVDLFLYANNYEAEGPEFEFFKDKEQAISVFKSGARMAKGTTTEMGLVKSYFANPFGPVQKQAETDVLIDKYFDKMYETGVNVGQIRTKLGIKGMEHKGPREVALKLLEYVKTL